MGRRSGFEGFLRATARAVAAAERERQRGIRAQLTQARQIERHQRMALAQQNRDERAAQKLAKAQYLADRQGEADEGEIGEQERHGIPAAGQGAHARRCPAAQPRRGEASGRGTVPGPRPEAPFCC